jgi:DNA-binding PadR family transcriptional regulator
MSKKPSQSDTKSFLPLPAADLQLLLILAERDLHAYGISRAVEAGKTGVRLEIGSLYRMLTRMEDQGMIEEREGPARSDAPESRRRYYGITPFGRRVARAEVTRLRAVVDLAESKRLTASR